MTGKWNFIDKEENMKKAVLTAALVLIAMSAAEAAQRAKLLEIPEVSRERRHENDGPVVSAGDR